MPFRYTEEGAARGLAMAAMGPRAESLPPTKNDENEEAEAASDMNRGLPQPKAFGPEDDGVVPAADAGFEKAANGVDDDAVAEVGRSCDRIRDAITA
ncbi:hypothetical protein HDU77_004013 [Chytriomyces hyalinus]|nr:hypothetical protein HDU77_004013 [Chytriomyces hyalinus]